MQTSSYSHAFLVGSLNGQMKPGQLEADPQWGEAQKIPFDGMAGYANLCSIYYKGHVDAMLQAEGQDRPRFLSCVSHYVHRVAADAQQVPLSTVSVRDGNTVVQHLDGYQLRICAIHLYFFPLDTILFALEIDDTGSELNDLTMGHFLLANWCWEGGMCFHDNTRNALSNVLSPLVPYLKDELLKNLIGGGNKMKLFQVIQLETSAVADDTLYELATSSRIGSVNGDTWLTPSEQYYQKIIDNNIVSAFNSWKGLALMDSFTVLGTHNGIRPEAWTNLYFPLIYLRAVFEKTFCFSRNNAYREDRAKSNLASEIALMEKYYFYDNISYNFLPNMLYQAMAKGLGIKEEREELSKQVKEKEDTNNSLIMAAISVFAIFSVAFDFYSLMKAWIAPDDSDLPMFALGVSALSFLGTITVVLYLTSLRRR